MSASVWRKCKLSALASDMTDGPFGSDLKMVHYTDKREARIVQLSNVGEDGWLDENVKYTTFSHAHEIGRCIIESGNIIIAKMMPAGRAILCPNHEPMFVQGSDVVKIVPNDRINPTFFVYMTKQNDYLKQIEKNTQGSTRARTSISKLKDISLIIPEDKETQNKLAQILATCDTVIQNTQKTIDKYKAIKQGMMQDLFTRGLTKDGKLRPSYKEAPELYKESELGMIPKEWEINTTEFLAQRLWIGLVTTMTSHYVDEGIPLIRNSDISENKIEDVEIFLDYDFAKANASREVHLGDVVTVHTGDIGTSSVINEKYDGAQGFATINTTVNKTIINEDYYCRYMNSFEFKKQALRAITGDGRQNLNIYDFINLLIPYPNDIKEQTLIVDRLKSIDSTIQREEAILEKYKNIKTGLMARLLTPPEDAEIIDETGE